MNADEIFDEAFQSWLGVEPDHIMSGVSERTLCARLAVHLQIQLLRRDLKHYFVDVECNRMHDRDFKVILNNDGTEKRINADLIAHGRAKIPKDDNLIAVEMKKSYRKDDDKNDDRKRLQSMTAATEGGPEFLDEQGRPKHVAGYLTGRYIEINSDARTVLVEEYRNGELSKSETVSL